MNDQNSDKYEDVPNFPVKASELQNICDELDKGVMPDLLRTVFAKAGITLSDEVIVTKRDERDGI